MPTSNGMHGYTTKISILSLKKFPKKIFQFLLFGSFKLFQEPRQTEALKAETVLKSISTLQNWRGRVEMLKTLRAMLSQILRITKRKMCLWNWDTENVCTETYTWKWGQFHKVFFCVRLARKDILRVLKKDF